MKGAPAPPGASGLEILVAREAFHHFSLHFIREFLPRKSQLPLDLPRGLALVCTPNGIENAAHETMASSATAGRQTGHRLLSCDTLKENNTDRIRDL
jgi:hypothetical protein